MVKRIRDVIELILHPRILFGLFAFIFLLALASLVSPPKKLLQQILPRHSIQEAEGVGLQIYAVFLLELSNVWVVGGASGNVWNAISSSPTPTPTPAPTSIQKHFDIEVHQETSLVS